MWKFWRWSWKGTQATWSFNEWAQKWLALERSQDSQDWKGLPHFPVKWCQGISQLWPQICESRLQKLPIPLSVFQGYKFETHLSLKNGTSIPTSFPNVTPTRTVVFGRGKLIEMGPIMSHRKSQEPGVSPWWCGDVPWDPPFRQATAWLGSGVEGNPASFGRDGGLWNQLCGGWMLFLIPPGWKEKLWDISDIWIRDDENMSKHRENCIWIYLDYLWLL